MVDTLEEWDDLVAELSEDWVEDNEYNGSTHVQSARARERG